MKIYGNSKFIQEIVTLDAFPIEYVVIIQSSTIQKYGKYEFTFTFEIFYVSKSKWLEFISSSSTRCA